MRGQQAEGSDALTAEDLAQFDTERNAALNQEPEPASKPEPEDTPEPDAEEPAAEDTPEDQRRRSVPHQAFHEERKLRQDAEARAQEDRRRAQTLEERMNLLLQRMTPQEQPAQQQEIPIPELEKDPIGHIQARMEQELRKRDQVLAAVVQAVTGQTQQTQHQQAVNQLVSRAASAEREFAAKTPDYQQAYEFVLDGRKRELQAAGWSDEAEINNYISREAMQLANHAFQVGRNPSELLYEMAKIRGYRASAQAPAAAQIDTIARGQNQARGINRIAGQGQGAINAATVANMSDEEFAKWADTAKVSERRRIMGG